jgi:hypothetical protein
MRCANSVAGFSARIIDYCLWQHPGIWKLALSLAAFVTDAAFPPQKKWQPIGGSAGRRKFICDKHLDRLQPQPVTARLGVASRVGVRPANN